MHGFTRAVAFWAAALALALVAPVLAEAQGASFSFSETIVLSSAGFASLEIGFSRTEGTLTLSVTATWDPGGFQCGGIGFHWKGESLSFSGGIEAGREGFQGGKLATELVRGDFRAFGGVTFTHLAFEEAWVGAEYAATWLSLGGGALLRPEGLGAKVWAGLSHPPFSFTGTWIFSTAGFESGHLEARWSGGQASIGGSLEFGAQGIAGLGAEVHLAFEHLTFDFAGLWEVTTVESVTAWAKALTPEPGGLKFQKLRLGVGVAIPTLLSPDETPGIPLARIFRPQDRHVQMGVEVEFDALGSKGGRGPIVEYDWDFGNGTKGTGRVAHHRYAHPGLYMVTLQVTDASGLTASATCTLIVGPAPIAADFTWQPLKPTPLDTVQFTDLSGKAPISWFWDFGDGTTSTEQDPIHQFPRKGTFVVCLTVADRYGRAFITCKELTVVNLPPIANPGGPYQGYVRQEIRFQGEKSYDPDGTIVAFLWDFGDGSTARGATVVHVYLKPGKYEVCLRVADEDGASSQACTVAYVTVPTSAGLQGGR